MPSSLGSSLWSDRQTKILQLAKILKFGNFNLKSMFRLFEWIYGVISFIPIDIYGHAIFERNAIVRLFSDVGSHIFYANPYY